MTALMAEGELHQESDGVSCNRTECLQISILRSIVLQTSGLLASSSLSIVLSRPILRSEREGAQSGQRFDTHVGRCRISLFDKRSARIGKLGDCVDA